MNSKWIYILALLFLPLIRFSVLDAGLDVWFASIHFDGIARFIVALRASDPFVSYVGNWALPVFVAAVLVFWVLEQGSADIPTQFLLLPIVYVPFSIVGMTLKTADFQFAYLYVHPLVILPFGYIYVAFWAMIVWLLGKAGVVD